MRYFHFSVCFSPFVYSDILQREQIANLNPAQNVKEDRSFEFNFDLRAAICFCVMATFGTSGLSFAIALAVNVFNTLFSENGGFRFLDSCILSTAHSFELTLLACC